MFPNRFGNHTDVGGIRLFQPVEHLQSFFGGWRIRLAQLLCQLIQTFPSRLLTLHLPFLDHPNNFAQPNPFADDFLPASAENPF